MQYSAACMGVSIKCVLSMAWYYNTVDASSLHVSITTDTTTSLVYNYVLHTGMAHLLAVRPTSS